MPWQPAGIVHPDAELTFSTIIRAGLAARGESYAVGVHVANTVPNPRYDRMVVVRRDGGQQSGLFDRPRLGIQVWGRTEQEATDLARLVTAILMGCPTGAPVLTMTHQSGPSPVPDESGQPKRYLVVEAMIRGSHL